jgi:hypothetical protein
VGQGSENTYKLKKGSEYPDDVLDGTKITLRTAIPGMKVPSARFLAIHAACAKIIHASGMAEVIDKVLEEREKVRVLSEDGSGYGYRLLQESLAVLAY